MITYRIKHHIKGRIRIEVPVLKGIPIAGLRHLADCLPELPGASGIKNVGANPVTGSLVLEYDPGTIDIMRFIEEVASSDEVQEIISKHSRCQSDDSRGT